MNNRNKKLILCTLVVLLLIAIVPFSINAYVTKSMEASILNLENTTQNPAQISGTLVENAREKNAQCIMVLGGGLKPDGTPNHMLEDRLNMGIALYENGVAPKLLLTGDNGQERYDEVNAMKKYAVDRGVPVEDIFLDHAGFSTYESMYRAKAIFHVDAMLVVTQKYHQYRSLYIAKAFGVEAYGVISEPTQYVGQDYREFREFLARNKDFLKTIVKPSPTYLGDAIPISGNGLASHDEE